MYFKLSLLEFDHKFFTLNLVIFDISTDNSQVFQIFNFSVKLILGEG